MDTRQNIRSTAVGETLTHKGNLIIEGDVERDTVINLSDGSLEIKGNVKAGAKIYLTTSDEFRSLPDREFAEQRKLFLTGKLFEIPKPQPVPKLIIHGNLEEGVIVQSDIDIKCLSTIGIKCRVISKGSIIANDVFANAYLVAAQRVGAKCVAEDTCISAPYGVDLKNTGKRVRIDVASGRVKIEKKLGKSSTVNARDEISVGKVGDFSRLTCNSGKIHLKHAGKNVTLAALEGITISTIDSNAEIQTTRGIVSAKCVGTHASIFAETKVEISSLGEKSKVSALFGTVEVGDLGNNVIIMARDSIIVRGRFPLSARLQSREIIQTNPKCADQDTHYYFYAPIEQLDSAPQAAATSAASSESAAAVARPMEVQPSSNDSPTNYEELAQQGLFARRDSQESSVEDAKNINNLSP